MNSNMKVGPMFKGMLTLKTVERLSASNRPIYSKTAETISFDKGCDRAINNAFTFMLEGDVSSNQVIVNRVMLNRALERIEALIGKKLPECLKGANVVAMGDVLSPKNMTFQLKTENHQVGDVHLFWESDVPYKALIKLVEREKATVDRSPRFFS